MPRMIEPDAMFPGERPRGLPVDAPMPDVGGLFARARALSSDPTRPLDTLRDILARENRRNGAHTKELDASGGKIGGEHG